MPNHEPILAWIDSQGDRSSIDGGGMGEYQYRHA